MIPPGDDAPLTGYRVIDYTHFLAGPYLSRCLAAMGADVIKVERPTTGDAGRQHAHVLANGESGYFLQQNMGKRGLCVDLRDPRGKALLQRLTDDADVFVENYRPGALDKLGFGYQALSARNPALVYCSISAYGHTGPNAGKPGFGLIAEAMSGIMAMVGNPNETPPLLRIPLGDMYTAAHGVAAVCAALLGRTKSGLGQHIDLALYDCLVSMHDYAIQCYTLTNGEIIPETTGQDLPTSTLYGAFSARDGHLVIAAQVDDTWRRFAALIGGDALAADQRFHSSTGRNTHREEILSLARAWVAARSRSDCLAELERAAVPAAPIQGIDDVVVDEQIRARGMLIEQDHPVLGKVTLPDLPFRFSGFSTSDTRPAPQLGQHNREIAAMAGFTDQDIDTMIADGILYST